MILKHILVIEGSGISYRKYKDYVYGGCQYRSAWKK